MNKNLLHNVVSRKGYTNEDVAKAIGVSRQSYQMRLSGKVKFSTEEVKTIADFLKLGKDDVMSIFFGSNV